MREIHATFRGGQVWLGYFLYKLSGTVVRSGCALTGVYGKGKPFTPFLPVPIETDITHAAGITKLFSLISAHYPKVLPEAELPNYYRLAENHNLGELENGDIPSDGTRDSKKINALEREWVISIIEATYPPKIAKSVIQFYDEFEAKSTPRGRFFYMLGDKLDGILSPLFFEKLGVEPDIYEKVNTHGKDPKKLVDIMSTKFTGTNLVADNFLYSEFYDPKFFKYPFLDVFLEIIQSAALSVRGKEMEWLNRELNRRISGYYDTT